MNDDRAMDWESSTKPLPTRAQILETLAIYPKIADTTQDFRDPALQPVVDDVADSILDRHWESYEMQVDPVELVRQLTKDQTPIDHADLLMLRDIFTAVISTERFGEGMFNHHLNTGLIQRAMRRLAVLADVPL